MSMSCCLFPSREFVQGAGGGGAPKVGRGLAPLPLKRVKEAIDKELRQINCCDAVEISKMLPQQEERES